MPLLQVAMMQLLQQGTVMHSIASDTWELEAGGSLEPEVWGQLWQQDFVLERKVGQGEEGREGNLLLMVPWYIQTSKNIEMWK